VEEWRFAADEELAELPALEDGCAGGDLPRTLELVLAPNVAPLVARATLAAGACLYALSPRRTSLEQLFLDIIGTEDSGQ
ncbi:MAG: hypothetical protein ACRDHE_13825, partial [Ktedonobacterales bacterium]